MVFECDIAARDWLYDESLDQTMGNNRQFCQSLPSGSIQRESSCCRTGTEPPVPVTTIQHRTGEKLSKHCSFDAAIPHSSLGLI